ncbi:hypothetical protein HED51_19850 [Ochrobactrum grignonense]|nr:hypothetical protein [Brucella grignonensis]NKB84438.1 hypothetical protein [Brucella grignonensis]
MRSVVLGRGSGAAAIFYSGGGGGGGGGKTRPLLQRVLAELAEVAHMRGAVEVAVNGTSLAVMEPKGLMVLRRAGFGHPVTSAMMVAVVAEEEVVV